jgi:hypothetical protein
MLWYMGNSLKRTGSLLLTTCCGAGDKKNGSAISSEATDVSSDGPFTVCSISRLIFRFSTNMLDEYYATQNRIADSIKEIHTDADAQEIKAG